MQMCITCIITSLIRFFLGGGHKVISLVSGASKQNFKNRYKIHIFLTEITSNFYSVPLYAMVE